ncbi:c-Myc-binding protein homolog [Bradysia coprophila]|uniref:c-Myc-binding protein homolog n=1 Tax=Bradysia coprophila TaxID=38358 RepID=UPI00187D98AF|nr:c-Myc-binding protein homolog [Bradysia coprophila]
MAFKPIDNKRDQFRKYLEASGVIEVLSKSITKLMESPEKPESPVDFIRENMGLTQKELNQIEFLKEEVEIYKKQVNDLKLEIAGLKQERQEVENGLSKVIADSIVKDDIVVAVSDNQSNQQLEIETKKTEDVEPTAPVVVAPAAVVTDDVQKIQKVDNVEEVSADVSVVAVATDAKIETKPEEIKAEEKPAAAATVVVAAAGDAAPETTDK